MVQVVIGRIDRTKVVSAEEGQTLKEVFEDNGFTISESEQVKDLEGNRYPLDYEIRDGNTFLLVRSMKVGY